MLLHGTAVLLSGYSISLNNISEDAVGVICSHMNPKNQKNNLL